MPRFYIAVRRDLPPGLAAAQAVHAALGFAARWPDVTAPWFRDSQFLVLVTVPDEVSLVALAGRALDAELQILTWHEPDLGNEATAVALEPGDGARRLCANFPLLGRQAVLALTG